MIDRRGFVSGCASATVMAAWQASDARALLAEQETLFGQGAAAALDRRFGAPDRTWLLIDAVGRTLAARWPEAERGVAPGSLLKPFLAAAWGAQNGFVYPQHECRGVADNCWYPAGHGRLTLEQALAQSCNAYFLVLAASLEARRARVSFASLGLHAPETHIAPEDMIGLTSAWYEQPFTLIHAYRTLLEDRTVDADERIAAGMRMAICEGTARGAAKAFGSTDLLAKTGTAVCGHARRSAADGFTLLAYPQERPRFLLLVREHGTTGAHTAELAGTMLRAVGLGTR